MSATLVLTMALAGNPPFHGAAYAPGYTTMHAPGYTTSFYAPGYTTWYAPGYTTYYAPGYTTSYYAPGYTTYYAPGYTTAWYSPRDTVGYRTWYWPGTTTRYYAPGYTTAYRGTHTDAARPLPYRDERARGAPQPTYGDRHHEYDAPPRRYEQEAYRPADHDRHRHAARPGERPAAIVRMTNDARFEPERVTIGVGQVIEWRNTSDHMHTVTADPEQADDPRQVMLPQGARPFDSGRLDPGQRFTHRLDTPGRYRYVCLPHERQGMIGEVEVLAEGEQRRREAERAPARPPDRPQPAY